MGEGITTEPALTPTPLTVDSFTRSTNIASELVTSNMRIRGSVTIQPRWIYVGLPTEAYYSASFPPSPSVDSEVADLVEMVNYENGSIESVTLLSPCETGCDDIDLEISYMKNPPMEGSIDGTVIVQT